MNKTKFKDMDVPAYTKERSNKAGGFAGYPDWGTEMIPNRIWKQKLIMTDYERGRSSVKIIFSDYVTKQYVGAMFISSFINASEFVEEGVILDGNWCIVKRGANYGLEFLGK